jgi:hypothetical protein
MPPLPPARLVLDSIQQTTLPAAGGAALVLALFLVFGRWAGALGSAAAVIAGFCWANYTFTTLSWDETGRVLPWKLEGTHSPAWHGLPRAAVVLIVVGLVSRWLGLLVARYQPEHRWWGSRLLTWAPRAAGVAVVSGWLVPSQFVESLWVWPALATAMLLSWVALDGLARDGAGGEVAVCLAAVFFAAGVVLIHAHSARFMDIAVILGCSMAGVAVVAGAAKADTSGAIPAGVGVLPGLMLSGRAVLDSNVPLASFWLVGLTPLVLLPFLHPAVARQNRWLILISPALLIFIPLAIAVLLAAQNEQLAFDEE